MDITLALIALALFVAAIAAKSRNARLQREKETAERIADAKSRALYRSAYPATVDVSGNPWASSVPINAAIWATELGGNAMTYDALTPEQQEIINKIFSEAGIDTSKIEVVKPAPAVNDDAWANARD
jgi:hypothetical protein